MSKKKSTKQRKQIKRTTRHFQLRVDHPQDAHVQEVLDYAKSQRREVTMIRDAVTLFYALENGNLEALFEKFPQYKTQFAPSTAEALEQFMEILRQQQMPVSIGAGQSIKYEPLIPLPAPPIAEIKQQSATVSASDIADNFLSMFQ
ncbi:MAG: hypothetical protein H0X30_22025 [Anaerolineae bacterium]|nr:hypothetical protein [Anaerolineae bacterium]